MVLNRWRKLLKKLSSSSSKARKRNRLEGWLRLETLEDRVTPSVRTWTGAGLDNLWQDAKNWAPIGGQTIAPSAGDDLVFPNKGLQLANNNNFSPGFVFNSISFTG